MANGSRVHIEYYIGWLQRSLGYLYKVDSVDFIFAFGSNYGSYKYFNCLLDHYSDRII